MKNALAALAAAFILSGASASAACAEGFALTDWSARGAALNGGLVARGGDASSVAFNPAAITELSGTQLMIGFDNVNHRETVTANPLGLKQKNGIKWYPVPHIYAAHKYSDKISLGLAAYARFGLGCKYNEGWFGQYNLNKVYLQVATLSPVVAWRISDALSFAAGPEISWASMSLNQSYPSKNILGVDNVLRINADGYCLGFTAGLHWRPLETVSVGFAYHSRMRLDVDGKAKWRMQIPGTAMSDSALSGIMKLPDQFSLGVAWSPTDRLSLEADVSLYTWSVYKNLDMEFKDLHAWQSNPKHWRDTWSFSVSAEYRLFDNFYLRAGYNYETSPVRAEFADYMAPTNGRQRFSGGIGWKHGSWTVDASYIYSTCRDLYFNPKTANGVYPGMTNKTHARGILIDVSYAF